MLSEIFDWWAGQMLDLLPSRLRGQPLHSSDATILSVTDLTGANIHVNLARRVRRVEKDLGSFVLDRAGITALGGALTAGRSLRLFLKIPPNLLLQRDCNLPLAAEADLARVLVYEMDRITPFSADDLFWTWRLLRRDRAHERLLLRVFLVHKAMLLPLLNQLREARLSPDLLVAQSDGGEWQFVPLQHHAASQGQRRRWSRLAFGICAVLLVAVVATPLVQNSRAIAAANARIDGLRPAIGKVEALRQRLAVDTDSSNILAAEFAKAGDPLQAIAALTDIIPDDAWLATLTLRQRVLIFSGQSNRAARLISALSADPGFRNPSFVTPVTRADSTGAELFTIRTEIGL